MSEDNLNQNDNNNIKNRDSKSEFFKKKFSISYPNTKEERESLFLEFKKREREYKIGSQMLLEENSLLIDRMDIYEMFNISFLFREVKKYDISDIKISNVHDFAKNMCEIGYLVRIEIPLYSKYMRKKHKGNEIVKYATWDCPKWRFDQLEAIKEKDQMFYLEDLQEMEIKRLELEIKRPKNNDEVVKKNLDRGELFQKEKTKRSMLKNEELGEIQKIKKAKDDLETQEKQILKDEEKIKIAKGEICISGATQQSLMKMKIGYEKELSSKFHNKGFNSQNPTKHKNVNWFKKHLKDCKMKFEDHPK